MHWSKWCPRSESRKTRRSSPRTGGISSVLCVLSVWLGFCSFAHTMTGIPVGKDATADKPQSKAWYQADSWWCILHDGREGSFFYQLKSEGLEKATFPDALVYPGSPTRADVLSNLNELCVLLWGAKESRFYKYRYIPEDRRYSLLEGFPVNFNFLPGHETAVLAQDSKGVLWVTYESQGTVYVSRSETGLHWQENQALGSSVADDDISTVISFGTQLGVFWSNQNMESLHFRIREDYESPQCWKEVEEVTQGGFVADDHLNMAATKGWVYAATKTSVDDAIGKLDGPTQAQIILNVRSNNRVWTMYDVAPLSSEDVTRPVVVLDDENREVYVFYRKGDEIVYKHTPLDKIDFSREPLSAITVPGVILNNVTSTKQNVNSTTGLLILATGDDGHAYHRLFPIR